MRIFSLLGLLIAVLIVGWLTAAYLGSMGGAGPVRVVPATESASPVTQASPGTTAAPQIRNVPIDKARELVNQDKERQKRMQEAMNQQ